MDHIPRYNRSDPHRRLLRHTYQEGPGFLFLATRGGRPSVQSPRPDLAGLRFRLPVWVVQAVIVVRLLTYWNSKRLAAEFSRRQIYPLDHHAVDGLLAQLGTARPSQRREKGPAYERARPNELWHIDIKGPFFLRRSRREYEKVWIVGLVDDHSRFLIGLRVLPRPQVQPILRWLDDCFELCGTPLELMSDNGSPFVVWMPGVLTLFGKTLEELRIRHLRTQINSPWTNGKIERFWGLLQAELLDRQLFPTREAPPMDWLASPATTDESQVPLRGTDAGCIVRQVRDARRTKAQARG